MLTLISPAHNSTLSLLSGAQKNFISKAIAISEMDVSVSENNPYPWLDPSITADDNASVPASVMLKWKNTEPSAKTVLHLACDPDFTETFRIGSIGRIHYSAEDDIYFTVLSNLLSGTTYYWKISCGDHVSETRSFSTVYGEFRTIRADGVGNIRDTGGRVNKDGKRIRQGLIYRGGMMNNLLKPETASLNGMGVLRDDLGIKTDIDLRWEAVGKYEFCPLGDHVAYHLFTAEGYEGIFSPGQDELFKNIFELLADENNYPIYYHCVAGADRTGTVGYLLDGLLGMNDNDIIMNYNLTALTDTRCWQKNVAEFVHILNERYPGLSLSEQMTEVLRSFGIAEETMARIRRNLIED